MFNFSAHVLSCDDSRHVKKGIKIFCSRLILIMVISLQLPGSFISCQTQLCLPVWSETRQSFFLNVQSPNLVLSINLKSSFFERLFCFFSHLTQINKAARIERRHGPPTHKRTIPNNKTKLNNQDGEERKERFRLS